MDLNHLHLHVRDVERAKRFYEAWLGLRERVRHGDILFLRNDDGFDLALGPAEVVEVFPRWFHFGFRLESPEAVRALHARMQRENEGRAGSLFDEPYRVSFHCQDPDGYAIEIYWE